MNTVLLASTGAALARTLLTDDERETYHFKFNERALLRGTLKDQADFFTKSLGAGGQASFMAQNEVRDSLDLPKSNDPGTDEIRGPITKQGNPNEPTPTA